MKIIESRDNPAVKAAASLKNSRARREGGVFFIEGLRLCTDAVQSGYKFSKAFFTAEFLKNHPQESEEIINCSDEGFEVTQSVMKKLADTQAPQGVFCVAKMRLPDYQTDKNGRYVILEEIADPGNLGTIARTAEALGVDALFVCAGCDIYNPKALRASMGSLLRIPVICFENIEPAINKMHSAGIKCYAAVVRDETCHAGAFDFSQGCAVVIGNEANGLTQRACELSDERITIKMPGRAESLNAAAAATILIWEMAGRK